MIEALWIPMVRGNVPVPRSSECEWLRTKSTKLFRLPIAQRVCVCVCVSVIRRHMTNTIIYFMTILRRQGDSVSRSIASQTSDGRHV